MRLCRDCTWFGGDLTIDHAECECHYPAEARIVSDYIDGTLTDVYPTCQDMRLANGKVVNYCGAEARFWEERK